MQENAALRQSPPNGTIIVMMGIRRCVPADAPDIARLVLVSAERFLPAVFGTGIEAAVRILAAGRGTLFSHAHCWIAEAGGSTAGMLLGYSGREKAAGDPATGWGLLRTLGFGLVRRLGKLHPGSLCPGQNGGLHRTRQGLHALGVAGGAKLPGEDGDATGAVAAHLGLGTVAIENPHAVVVARGGGPLQQNDAVRSGRDVPGAGGAGQFRGVAVLKQTLAVVNHQEVVACA